MKNSIVKLSFIIFSLINININNCTATCNLYLLTLEQFLIDNPDVSYKKCSDITHFSFKPFPFSINHNNHPHAGYFHENFILNIPNALIQSPSGFIVHNDQIIKELVWKQRMHNLNVLCKVPDEFIVKIQGKVAVIAQPAYSNYWHWLTEVLCRLALLELHNIEYDFLYVNQTCNFMKQTLELWGIPNEKIIVPTHPSFCVQADQVIVPSIVSNVSFGFVPFSCYAQPELIKYVQEKLLSSALTQNPSFDMSKKIFISRKDSNIRNVLNEDEVFNILKPYEFQRYELSKLSVIDQIHLFNQAEIVVSPQGTGLANTIFCNKNVKIIEIFQGLNDCTFWYLSQQLNLNYNAIKTIDFIPDYMTAWQSPTYIPLEII